MTASSFRMEVHIQLYVNMDLSALIVQITRPSHLSDAAQGMKVDPGCAEGRLGLLTAALRELRAALTDPAQYDGEHGRWV